MDFIFLFEGGTEGDQSKIGALPNRLNFSNKIILISNLMFFYILPLISSGIVKIGKIKFSEIFFIILISLPIIYFFNYNLVEITGGGIFYHLSWKLFNNNSIVFIIFVLSVFFIIDIIKKDKFNFLILLILIISNVQLTIYHKYYDPLFLILFFTIFNLNIKNFGKKSLIHIYFFSISFFIINFLF